MKKIIYEIEFCKILDKPWKEATLEEFIYDCPKAFQHCSNCEHCEKRQITEYYQPIPIGQAF